MADQALWVGRCPEFHSIPYPTREQAERWCAGVDHMGNCPHPHHVEQLERDEHGVVRFPDGRMAP